MFVGAHFGLEKPDTSDAPHWRLGDSRVRGSTVRVPFLSCRLLLPLEKPLGEDSCSHHLELPQTLNADILGSRGILLLQISKFQSLTCNNDLSPECLVTSIQITPVVACETHQERWIESPTLAGGFGIAVQFSLRISGGLWLEATCEPSQSLATTLVTEQV